VILREQTHLIEMQIAHKKDVVVASAKEEYKALIARFHQLTQLARHRLSHVTESASGE